MEIHCTNIPEHATEKSLRKSLGPTLHSLGITAYHIKKHRGKSAALTISEIAKARLFLESYGEKEENAFPVQPNGAPASNTIPTKPPAQSLRTSLQLDGSGQQSQYQTRPLGLSRHDNNSHSRRGGHQQPRLKISERFVYFRKSKYEPDEFLLRSLRDDPVRSVVQNSHTRSTAHPVGLQKKFAVHTLSCGSWDYKDGYPVFSTYFQHRVGGEICFRRRFLKLTMRSDLTTTHDIEFDYESMVSLYIDNSTGGNPSLTITMEIAPRLYEDSLLKMMLSMSINTRQKSFRDRVDSLGGSWNGTGATCFVYRVHFTELGDLRRVMALKQVRTIPDMIIWRAPSLQTQLPYSTEMEYFNSRLSSEELPFAIKFQLQMLVNNGELAPMKVLDKVFEPAKRLLKRVGIAQTVQVIKRLPRSLPFAGPEIQSSEYDIDKLVEQLFDPEEADDMVFDWVALGGETLHPHRVSIHKAIVTPLGVYLTGPLEECSNRVLRRYAEFSEYFMRVEFAEETGDPMRYDPTASLEYMYNGRFKRVLEDGIVVGGRQFEFLGFSHSSLRSQSCWFMSPFASSEDGYLTAREMVPLLGDFSRIFSPAKYAARLGQVFSDTMTSIAVSSDIVKIAGDVERNDRTFSDGVGTISAAVMKKIFREYALRAVVKPTVFQLRFAGAKGMVSYDSRLEGDKLVLRPSMNKFVVDKPWFIEVCGAGIRPLTMYLNRPLIKILEDLGVPAEPFIELQQNEVESMRLNTKSPLLTADLLESANLAQSTQLPSLLRSLGNLDIQYSSDTFLRHAVELAVLIKLRELKYRARIRIEDGATLYGIMDETGHLQEGEIFVPIQRERGGRVVLEGEKVVVTRSPALHPGDVQLARAVDVPDASPLQQLHNCVVFSQWGERDLPSKLSGGDLDGDLYNVIWDASLTPKDSREPADYTKLPPDNLDRPVERSDVIDHFLTFMQQDQLGRIASVHLTIADQNPLGTLSEDCLTLAELHSTAVDFSKTGIPADISRIPRYPPSRPDFMAPGPRVKVAENIQAVELDRESKANDDDEDEDEGPSVRYYKSDKVLGRLFRGIDEIEFLDELEKSIRPSDPNTPSALSALWAYVEHTTTLLLWERHKDAAKDIKEMYDDNLLDLMHQFSVTARKSSLTEVEVFIGNIIGKNDGQTKRQREASVAMREKYDRLVQEIVSQILHYAGGGKDALERAIACLAIAVEDEKTEQAENRKASRAKTQRLQSFRWIAAAVCVREVERVNKVNDKSLRRMMKEGMQG